MMMPLAFVVLVSMVKDMIEDYSRYKSDQEENSKETCYSKRGERKFIKSEARSIQVGCIVKVTDD